MFAHSSVLVHCIEMSLTYDINKLSQSCKTPFKIQNYVGDNKIFMHYAVELKNGFK